MKKELVVLVDYFTCQKNGVPFDDNVERLVTGFESYATKVIRDPSTKLTEDYSRIWAVSRFTSAGNVEKNIRLFETARKIFVNLKNAAR